MGQRHEVRHIRCVTVYDANSSPLNGLNLVNLILGLGLGLVILVSVLVFGLVYITEC